MSPDKKPPPRARSKRPPVKTKPSSSDPYAIKYFRRPKTADPKEAVPGREFLSACPAGVRATIRATIVAVAAAPPPRFAGGGYWEAMHDDMAGFYEVRVNGPGRTHYRLFCVLDSAAVDDKGAVAGPYLTIIGGASKPFRTEMAPSEYKKVKALRAEYLATNPRSVV